MPAFASTPAPVHTLWDAPEMATQRLAGIWSVRTRSHGGFVLSDERQAAHYEKWRRVMLAGVGSPSDFKPYDTSSPRLQELDARANAAIEKQHALNRPKPRRYETRPAAGKR